MLFYSNDVVLALLTLFVLACVYFVMLNIMEVTDLH